MFVVLHVLLVLPLPVESVFEASNQIIVVLWVLVSGSVVKPELCVTFFVRRIKGAALTKDREALRSISGK